MTQLSVCVLLTFVPQPVETAPIETFDGVKLPNRPQLDPRDPDGAKLIKGGAVAEHVVNGEAEIGVHQISEILPVKGATLVGPLPKEIQNYTVYAAGAGAAARDGDAAKALIRFLSGPAAAPVLKAKGMEAAAK